MRGLFIYLVNNFISVADWDLLFITCNIIQENEKLNNGKKNEGQTNKILAILFLQI